MLIWLPSILLTSILTCILTSILLSSILTRIQASPSQLLCLGVGGLCAHSKTFFSLVAGCRGDSGAIARQEKDCAEYFVRNRDPSVSDSRRELWTQGIHLIEQEPAFSIHDGGESGYARLGRAGPTTGRSSASSPTSGPTPRHS